MQSIILEIQADLLRFIRNPRERMLIIASEPENSPLLLKSLNAAEEAPDSPDIFLTFAHNFESPDEFVRQIPPVIHGQVEMVNQEHNKRGEAPIAGLTDGLAGGISPAMERLLELMRQVERIVPADRQVIWLFFSMQIIDESGWLKMNQFLLQNLSTKLLGRTKLIVRDSEKAPVLAPSFERQPEVRIWRPELDAQSFERKIAEKAVDPNVPLEERAQLHMMLAGFDIAHQRFDMALRRNLELLGHFRHTGQQHQQSIVLNNIGDLHYMQGRFSEAQTWYERAINVSVNLQSQPMVLYQSINLGNAHLAQRRYDDALIYYKAGEQLAGISGIRPQQIQALERIGTAHYEAHRKQEAAEAWEKAAQISRELKFDDSLQTNLENLHRLYRDVGNSSRMKACESELAQLKAANSSGKHAHSH